MHSKQTLQKMSKAKLISLLVFVLTLLKVDHPQIYKKIQGRNTRVQNMQKRKGGSKKKRRLSPGEHTVRINGHERKIHVSVKGKWKFLKD